MICPLCLSAESEKFDQDKTRSYQKCLHCDLVFVPRDSLISTSAEKERYEAHENEPNDHYTSYLKKIADAIEPFLPKSATGLDFGCGRTKILEKILIAKGFTAQSYDVYFHHDENVFESQYDFIILSEVIEHLRDPREIMLKLTNNLTPHGQLFIKTKPRPESRDAFNKWFYKRDSTHVQFFNDTSMKELTAILGMKNVEMVGEDLFRITQ